MNEKDRQKVNLFSWLGRMVVVQTFEEDYIAELGRDILEIRTLLNEERYDIRE